MARTVRSKSKAAQARPGSAPLRAALTEIEAAATGSFTQIEPRFVEAMWEFDKLVASGDTTQGDRQNGKGDFFNDVIAALLERCSGKTLHTRPGIPGLLFPRHSLDVAYPDTGTVELTVETKATGIPKHSRSAAQDASGRRGSADLEKRIKEAAFKDIDIKGEYSRTLGQGGGATSDLRRWLSQTPPRNWLFLSTRVRDETDLKATIRYAEIASQWFEGCGLFAYGPENFDLRRSYVAQDVPTPIQLDRVLHNVCTALRAMA